MAVAREVKQFLAEFATPEFQDLMVTIAMTRIGTAFFMAPEINRGEVYSQGVDCFAWAKMALRCHRLCGFIKKEILRKVTEEEMSKNFIVAITNALDEEPDDRSSAKQILKELGCNLELRQGHGEKKLAEGHTYVGTFRNFKMNGTGKLSFADNSVYQGGFKNDKMSGLGVMNYPDGRSYSGHFENNMKNGQGEMSWPDDDSQNLPNNWRPKKYVGMFENDQIRGPGKLTYHNCDFYDEGQFEGDFVGVSGPGRRVYDKGIYEGMIIEGSFKDFSIEGDAVVTYNSARYHGVINNENIDFIFCILQGGKGHFATEYFINQLQDKDNKISALEEKTNDLMAQFDREISDLENKNNDLALQLEASNKLVAQFEVYKQKEEKERQESQEKEQQEKKQRLEKERKEKERQERIEQNRILNESNKQKYNVSKSMTELYLQKKNITVLPYFFELPNLTNIDAFGNQISKIDEYHFIENINVSDLRLNHNNINQIHCNAFINLVALTEIFLCSNQMENVPKNLFQNNNLLKIIDFENNKIQKIDVDLFKNLEQLEKLYLFHNKIDFINIETFRNNKNLNYLYIDNNNLTESNKNEIKSDNQYSKINELYV